MRRRPLLLGALGAAALAGCLVQRGIGYVRVLPNARYVQVTPYERTVAIGPPDRLCTCDADRPSSWRTLVDGAVAVQEGRADSAEFSSPHGCAEAGCTVRIEELDRGYAVTVLGCRVDGSTCSEALVDVSRRDYLSIVGFMH